MLFGLDAVWRLGRFGDYSRRVIRELERAAVLDKPSPSRATR
jgi:hypothetical protein